MAHNYGASPISSRTARDASRIRPSASSSASPLSSAAPKVIYFGPGMSSTSSPVRPLHSKRPRRDALLSSQSSAILAPKRDALAIAPAPLSSSPSLPVLARASIQQQGLLPPSASGTQLAPRGGSTPASAFASASSSRVTASTPAPAPTLTASLMLDILKDGPQLPAPRVPPQRRLAELGRESAGTKRQASTQQGAVSSPAWEARRAELRKQLEEREKAKRREKRKEADDADMSEGGDTSADVSIGKSRAGLGAPPAKKPMTLLAMIERTAGSGGGLPPRRAPSASASASTSISRPLLQNGNAKTASAAATMMTAVTSTPASKMAPLPAPASNKPTFAAPSLAFPPSSSSSTTKETATRPPTFTLDSAQPSSKAPPAAAAKPLLFSGPAAAAPAPSAAALQTASKRDATDTGPLPTFDLGLDVVVQTLLKAGDASRDAQAQERAGALAVDRSKLPSYSFIL